MAMSCLVEEKEENCPVIQMLKNARTVLAVYMVCHVYQMPLFLRSSALAARADRTRGASVASGSAPWMN